MISWVVIIILVVCGIFAIKMNHLRHRVFILGFVLLALFLYTTVSVVNTVNEVDFTSVEGFFDASKLYFGWLGNGFKNLKTITTNAIKMDWSSTNGSFFEFDKIKIDQVKK